MSVETQSPLDRIGLYLWGGPGMIRMNKVKYFAVRQDEDSIMHSYDADYLTRIKDLFGITDLWVTYSWGFSEATEAEDYAFLLKHLPEMKKLGFRVHAYVQGPNLVYREFPQATWWARDEKQRPITYYKGRWVCSIHDENYVEFVENKIKKTYGLGFDGIFIDNMQHGQLGVPMPDGMKPFVFCGDASPIAQAAFKAETGAYIPDDFERDPALTDAYLEFRVRANTNYVARLSEIVRAGGMEIGCNFYDPKFDPYYTYGIDIKAMEPHLDYILFENHSLPTSDGAKHNAYVEDFIRENNISVPVFVVSYAQGVGIEPQFTQEQIDNLFSEGKNANFHLCMKGGEFTTRRRWHSLYLDGLTTPNRDKILPRQARNLDSGLVNALVNNPLARRLLKKYYNPIYTAAFERRSLRIIVYLVYLTTLK